MNRPDLCRLAHEAMGTYFEVLITAVERTYACQAAQAAFTEIDRIERMFSRFDPGSDISQINRLPAGATMAIGLETFECLERAEKIRCETGGAFDVCLAASGTLPRLNLLRTPTGFAVGVVFANPGLDLGGIGKGYSLDRAALILADWGIEQALIHGGTSTALAIGKADWPIGTGGTASEPFLLCNRALSGSGSEVKGWHIIDPRIGRPAQGRRAAWACHPAATEADALSTAFMVMEAAAVEEYCRRHPQVWARQLDESGRVQTFNGHLGNPQ